MSNHVSECWCANRPCPRYPGATCPCRECICDELRACEQRVLDAARQAVAETQRWHEFSWGMDDDEDGEYVKTEEALDAIDALRKNP